MQTQFGKAVPQQTLLGALLYGFDDAVCASMFSNKPLRPLEKLVFFWHKGSDLILFRGFRVKEVKYKYKQHISDLDKHLNNFYIKSY